MAKGGAQTKAAITEKYGNQATRVGKGAKQLQLVRRLKPFQIWLGHELAATQLDPFGGVVVGELTSDEKKEWNAFNECADKVEAWYNELRQKQFTPAILDTVCLAISSTHPDDKRCLIYAQGLATKENSRRPRTGAAEPTDDQYVAQRWSTFDGTRRKSFDCYKLSPYFTAPSNQGNSKQHLHHDVLLSLQALWNERYRRNLCYHGLDTFYFAVNAGVTRQRQPLEDFIIEKLTLCRPSRTTPILKQHGINTQEKLSGGRYYFNTNNGVETTLDPMEAPTSLQSTAVATNGATAATPVTPPQPSGTDSAIVKEETADVKIKEESTNDDNVIPNNSIPTVTQSNRKRSNGEDDSAPPNMNKRVKAAPHAEISYPAHRQHQGHNAPAKTNGDVDDKPVAVETAPQTENEYVSLAPKNDEVINSNGPSYTSTLMSSILSALSNSMPRESDTPMQDVCHPNGPPVGVDAAPPGEAGEHSTIAAASFATLHSARATEVKASGTPVVEGGKGAATPDVDAGEESATPLEGGVKAAGTPDINGVKGCATPTSDGVKPTSTPTVDSTQGVTAVSGTAAGIPNAPDSESMQGVTAPFSTDAETPVTPDLDGTEGPATPREEQLESFRAPESESMQDLDGTEGPATPLEEKFKGLDAPDVDSLNIPATPAADSVMVDAAPDPDPREVLGIQSGDSVKAAATPITDASDRFSLQSKTT
ncbi:hypothetical protein LTR15_011803 [Elasticomyces elasticus]|nr:hypothetical protein LTR15_011803 [Elasticomyces elasticus]